MLKVKLVLILVILFVSATLGSFLLFKLFGSASPPGTRLSEVTELKMTDLLKAPKKPSASQEPENPLGVLIKLRQPQDKKSLAEKLGLTEDKIEEVAEGKLFNIQKDEQALKTVLADQIEYLEKDQIIKPFVSANDTYYSSQTHLSRVTAPSAWDYSTGSTSIKIAIIDSGINGQHEDLSGRVLAGYDTQTDSAISAGADSDDYGHGTLVAGAAFSVTNNSIGLAGVDWQAYLVPVRIFNAAGYGTTSDAVEGIRWAADNGAHIFNMSFGQDSDSQSLKEAIEYAWNRGKILVAATGNDSRDGTSYPARYSQVIGVGSLQEGGDVRYASSNYGEGLDVMAPGERVWTTLDALTGVKYTVATGTSLAAPLVAGQAGLIVAYNPNLTNSDVYSAILDTADGLGSSNEYGQGRINIVNSLGRYGVYNHSYHSQNGHPTLDPGGSYQFVLAVTNTGRSIWHQGIVNLGTDRQRDRVSAFAREGDGPSGWLMANRIKMDQSSVAPGQTATFSFWLKAPENMASGTYREYFRLVADGIAWLEDYGIYWDIQVRSPEESLNNQYQHSYHSQNGYPTISRGSSYNFVATVTNTGTATWQQNQVNLGTDRDRDRVSRFTREGDGSSGWITPNRIKMNESSVAPGATGTFSFWLKAPENMSPGTYREYFRLVADGLLWLEDYGIYWDVTVR